MLRLWNHVECVTNIIELEVTLHGHWKTGNEWHFRLPYQKSDISFFIVQNVGKEMRFHSVHIYLLTDSVVYLTRSTFFFSALYIKRDESLNI